MRKLFLSFLILMLGTTLGYCQTLGLPFSKIRVHDNRVILQFHDHGVKWLFGVNGGVKKMSQYGEVVKLKTGDKMELLEKHTAIRLKVEHKKGQYSLLVHSTNRDAGGKKSIKDYSVWVNAKSKG